ncbi:hypothetical protein F3Y22_tig00111718pilonHSYRG00012 [Hibiscus syriacus]|uniref:Uncharacterized protein n=1 Tax=Hibiscus syriacus TaxID=106335 RepID=A0A6A2XFQ5_HIBSY|nr:uncharacterized protein LOC120168251 [Hibiscus syriacus]KAE8674741.1 hypothetical protein F3Y22_tig00111718pilonHSYRG00012 [Hibiscus syriacus]
MEVVIPAMDFDFNSARSSPRSTAPCTPTRVGGGGCFFSAPTSPARLSEFYREFDRFSMMGDRQCSRRSNSLAIPFDWEEKPGTPKSPRVEEEDDFAFDFSEALEKTSLSAEQLFDGGKIKPLKPPPRLQVEEYNQKNPLLSSPRSPKSPLSQGKKFIREAFSPRKKKDRDPFETAIETSRNQTDELRRGRERERVEDLSKNSSRRATRALSPYRVSTYPWEEEEEKQKQNESTISKPSSLNSKPSVSSNKVSSRKWRLRDFFLFRSASEGHATDKDRFRKYSSSFFKKPQDNSKSRDVGSVAGGSGRKVSAHEVHYAPNEAVSENMKKKTFLPYKHGILGRLALNPRF